MTCFRLAAFLAVSLVSLVVSNRATAAHPIPFPCGLGFTRHGICLGIFPGIHQHGPLFNYGPYYGYYPFKPYGPWDAYLRYDPFFYGDPYAADWAKLYGTPPNTAETGNWYGWNPKLYNHKGLGGHLLQWNLSLPRLNLCSWWPWNLRGCGACGFLHAAWLHGGWFRGHVWLLGGFGGCATRVFCRSCSGLAVVDPVPNGDPTHRLSGIGTPADFTVFYAGFPVLDPAVDVPSAGVRE